MVQSSYSREEASDAAARSLSIAETLRRLGMCTTGNNRLVLKRRITEWGISTAHFDPDAARRAGLRHDPTPLEEVLVEGSNYHRGKLKKRLYEAGLKARQCEMCGQGEEWNGRCMSLILDHVNGVANDNRLENLRIVCPNCGATLDTHCGRKGRTPSQLRECGLCGKPFLPNRESQRYCSRKCGQRHPRRYLQTPRPERRKVPRPPYEVLRAELEASSYVAVGRKYGVSGNAVRKWVRWYERDFHAARGEE